MKFSLDSIAEDLSYLNIAILELLESDNQSPIEGNTAFQKEMFLIGNFIDDVGEDAEFIPHSFGPYSEAAEVSLNDLISLGLARKEYKNNYKITDAGSRVLKIVQKRFSDEELESIADFKRFLGELTVDEILLFVYASYPKYTIESTVYKRIMRKRLSDAISIYKKGLISLEKAAFLAGMNIESFLDTLKEAQI
ncbi:hypothetical protein FXV91_17320 [Methanosarcina sp. DH2]|uniref:UPF0175 family protein n=1 Tax=Methanosarcina sp. DH2 TaxID=2605639 RepID=UPI001E613C57|nr:UPF0175 family protein [Methanosarcina sp. DH2]MCC4771859.1 hypothetical protein [Methanosarcina sp. DH2]